METVKELLQGKAFNKFNYVGLIFWVLVGFIFVGLFGTAEKEQIKDFSCDYEESKKKDHINGFCFDQYKEQHNKNVPFYAIVLVQLILVLVVSVFYSVIVKSRIHEPENLLDFTRRNTRKLFAAYFCQLSARLIIGIVFLALQTGFFTPSLPSNYVCDYTETQKYNCTYHKAGKETFYAWICVALFSLFLLFLLVELGWILWRAKMETHFMDDAQFLGVHLQSKDLLNVFIERNKERIRKCTKQLSLFPSYSPSVGSETVHEMEIDQVGYPKLLCYPEKVNYNSISENTQKLFLRKSGTILENPEDMFVGNKPNRILIVGSPGIGKTFFCQKLLRDWASGKIFDKKKNREMYFEFAFLFCFRRFNKEDEFSLYQLLAHAEHSDSDHDLEHSVTSYFHENASKILLVFDGLDEFTDKQILIDDNNFNAYPGNEENIQMPFYVLYRKLASGKLLTGATVITTVRCRTVSSLRRIPFTRNIDILELTPEEVPNCVERYTIRGEAREETALDHIRSNTVLLSLCCIPANCAIVCWYLQLLFQLGYDSTPERLTEVLTGILKMFLFRFNPEYHNLTQKRVEFNSNTFPRTFNNHLTKLAEIAYNGISEGKYIFELEKVKGLETTGVLHRLPEHRFGLGSGHPPKYFCFAHVSIQEYLAARYLVKQTADELSNFVSEHIAEGKWQQVIQFVAGLLDDTQLSIKIWNKHMRTIFSETKTLLSADADDDDSEQSTLTCWPSNKDKAVVVTLCKFMFECHKSTRRVIDQTSVEKAVCNVIDLSECGVNSIDCAALANVLPYIGICNVSRIRLNDNHIRSLGCKEIGELFFLKRDLRTLEIDGNDISDNGVERLCSALSRSKLNLRKLSLGRNEITDEGVKRLCTLLGLSDCKITQLNLSSNNIGDEGIKSLSDTLSTGMCRLSRLNLSQNNLSDEHVRNLSQRALSRKECQLNQLILSKNKITDVGVEHLCDALSTKDCHLVQLRLSSNLITEMGMTHLSRALSRDTSALHRYNVASSRQVTLV